MSLRAVSASLRHAALSTVVIFVLLGLYHTPFTQAANLTLAWDPASDPSVAGYNVYYGSESRNYTNSIGAGTNTRATISNLVAGVTYYFAATTYNAAGLESDFSAEAFYEPPIVVLNWPPTLDPIADVTLSEDAALQTIPIYGISSGAFTETQTLVVSAFSSNPNLIPNPTVTYVSPQMSGSLTFTPVVGSFGTARVTVMVDDGGVVSNTVIRTFSVTVNPVNDPPTLNAINNLTINQSAGPQTVTLSGIAAGPSNENQTVTITAVSSNPGLVPTPTVNYSNPSTTGSLSFTPVTNAFGTADITVTANDGQTTNATISRVFTVTVNQVIPLNTMTNGIVAPNQVFRFVLNPPVNNGHRFNFALDANAPEGVKISTRRGVTALVWTPTTAQASTTNVIVIHATDSTTSVTTNENLLVTVLDYAKVFGNSTAVQAGQSASLPLSVESSEGLTNVTFTISFPTNRFGNPTLSIPSPTLVAGTVQLQRTNVLVQLRSLSGQILTGSNLIALLNFQALPGQTSAFISLGVTNVTAVKATGQSYVENWSQAAQVAVVNNLPLLETSLVGSTRALRTYGKVGMSYQVQSSTNLVSPNWTAVTTYVQTNVAQTVAVGGAAPVIFYRLQQQ